MSGPNVIRTWPATPAAANTSANHSAGLQEQRISSAALEAIRRDIGPAQALKAALRPKSGPFDRNTYKVFQEVEQYALMDAYGFREHQLHVQGYTPIRYEVTFVGERGERLQHEVVSFARQDNQGNWTYRTAEDTESPSDAVALNADLYDARHVSARSRHVDYSTTVMPSLNGNGEWAGVWTLFGDQPPVVKP